MFYPFVDDLIAIVDRLELQRHAAEHFVSDCRREEERRGRRCRRVVVREEYLEVAGCGMSSGGERETPLVLGYLLELVREDGPQRLQLHLATLEVVAHFGRKQSKKHALILPFELQKDTH